MAHAWWSFYSLYMGEGEKNTKINVTFSLSGWAMPFLQRRPGLWQMLRLSPRTGSPRSVCLAEAGEGKHSGHSCRLLLSAASSARSPVSPGRAAQDRAMLDPHLPATRRREPGPGRRSTRAHRTLTPSSQEEAPAAACSAEESLVALTHSDKIHFIGFVLQFDIGSWDSNFMSRTITIAAGTFKKCVYPFYFNSYIIKIYLCQTPYKGTI